MLPATLRVWQPTTADLCSLGDDGRALLDGVLDAFEPSITDGAQLVEACRAADTLAALRAQPNPDLRQIRLWSGHYTGLLRALGLTK